MRFTGIALLLVISLASPALAAGDATDSNFLAALQQIDNGQATEAIAALEALYAKTKAPRVRLELARAYLFAGMKEKARETFIAAYEDNPPPGVKSTILNFLNRMSLQEGKFTYGISLTKVTNPLNQPSAFGINFGGTYLELSQDTAAKNLTGVLFSGGYEKTIDSGYSLRTSLSYRYMPVPSANLFMTDTYVSKDVVTLNSQFRAGLELIDMTGQSYQMPYVASLYKYDITPMFNVIPMVQVGYYNSTVSTAFSGLHYRFGLPVNYSIDPSKIFSIGPKAEFHDSQLSTLRYFTYGIGFDASLRFDFITINTSVMPRITEFASVDPFWGVVRKDKGLFGSIEVSSDYVRYDGFLPSVNAYCNSNGSNVKFYTLNGCGFSFGLTKIY